MELHLLPNIFREKRLVMVYRVCCKFSIVKFILGYLELSSLETYVWDNYRRRKFEWLPFNRSSKIDGNEQEEKDKLNKTITDIILFQDQIKEMSSKVSYDEGIVIRLVKIERSIVLLRGSVEAYNTGTGGWDRLLGKYILYIMGQGGICWIYIKL